MVSLGGGGEVMCTMSRKASPERVKVCKDEQQCIRWTGGEGMRKEQHVQRHRGMDSISALP